VGILRHFLNPAVGGQKDATQKDNSQNNGNIA
jgi:hypothetical protein